MSQQPKAVKAWCVVDQKGMIFHFTIRETEYEATEVFESHTQCFFEACKKKYGYRCIRVTITPDTGDEG